MWLQVSSFQSPKCHYWENRALLRAEIAIVPAFGKGQGNQMAGEGTPILAGRGGAPTTTPPPSRRGGSQEAARR